MVHAQGTLGKNHARMLLLQNVHHAQTEMFCCLPYSGCSHGSLSLLGSLDLALSLSLGLVLAFALPDCLCLVGKLGLGTGRPSPGRRCW